MKVILISIFLFFNAVCFAEIVSVESIVSDFVQNDEKIFEVRGEALIILKRKTGVWINVNDKTESIGVWVDEKIKLPEIKNFASYKHTGDILRIKGVFKKADKKHFGEMSIEAEEVSIESEGKPTAEHIDQNKEKFLFWTGITLFIIICIYFLKKVLNERKLTKNS